MQSKTVFTNELCIMSEESDPGVWYCLFTDVQLHTTKDYLCFMCSLRAEGDRYTVDLW